MTEAATSRHNPDRQSVLYCPYCAEETLFPLEGVGWECRSCFRAFSVAFLGLVSRDRSPQEQTMSSARGTTPSNPGGVHDDTREHAR